MLNHPCKTSRRRCDGAGLKAPREAMHMGFRSSGTHQEPTSFAPYGFTRAQRSRSLVPVPPCPRTSAGLVQDHASTACVCARSATVTVSAALAGSSLRSKLRLRQPSPPQGLLAPQPAALSHGSADFEVLRLQLLCLHTFRSHVDCLQLLCISVACIAFAEGDGVEADTGSGAIPAQV